MDRRHFLAAVAALPLTAPSTLQGAVRGPPDVPYDWLARYQVVYNPKNQGPTGACDHTSATTAMQAVSLNVQNAQLPPLSWGFSYLGDTHDPTFTVGSFASRAASFLQTTGTCTDALYSENTVLQNWQGGGAYPAEALPSPACYADAPSHRLTDFVYLAIGSRFGYPPDIGLIRQLLLAGYPITLAIGRHAVCLLRVDPPDYYWFAGMDSELAGIDAYGMGFGARPFTADMIYNDGWDICVYLEVSGGVAFQPCRVGWVCTTSVPPIKIPPRRAVPRKVL